MMDPIFKAIIYFTIAAACFYLAAENYHDFVEAFFNGN